MNKDVMSRTGRWIGVLLGVWTLGTLICYVFTITSGGIEQYLYFDYAPNAGRLVIASALVWIAWSLWIQKGQEEERVGGAR